MLYLENVVNCQGIFSLKQFQLLAIPGNEAKVHIEKTQDHICNGRKLFLTVMIIIQSRLRSFLNRFRAIFGYYVRYDTSIHSVQHLGRPDVGRDIFGVVLQLFAQSFFIDKPVIEIPIIEIPIPASDQGFQPIYKHSVTVVTKY